MKVAIDADPLVLSSGGVTRYTEQLSTALASEFPEDDFVLLCDHPFRMPAEAPRNLRAGSPPAFRYGKHWWTIGVQRAMFRDGCDLFHGTSFLVPWLPVRPSVVTAARPVALDGAEVAPARRLRPLAHALPARAGAGGNADHSQRGGAAAGDRAFPRASGACRDGAAGGSGAFPARGWAAALESLLRFRGHAGAAQESGDAARCVAGGPPQARGGPGASWADQGGLRRTAPP